MNAVSFRDVERSILAQHQEIRARIRGLMRNAERVDLPWAQRALRILLFRFAAEFDAHLAFEERELAPRVRELDAWGKAREAALHAEHREQRERLERACLLAEEPALSDTNLLFDAVSALGDSLLADMAHEERTLAELAWIDENGHKDQMTG